MKSSFMKIKKYGKIADSQFEKNHIHSMLIFYDFLIITKFLNNCVDVFDISEGWPLIQKNIQMCAAIDKVDRKKGLCLILKLNSFKNSQKFLNW